MSVRRLSFDLALDDPRTPDIGDVLTTARKVYRVTEARPVDSRVWGNRWKLTVCEIGTATNGCPDEPPMLEVDGAQMWFSSLYRKGETPAEFFAKQRTAA